MKSMTGFGNAVFKSSDFDLSVDIASVNKKGFELSVYLPRKWQGMERLIAAELKRDFSRGKLTVRVAFATANSQGFSAYAAVKTRMSELESLCDSCNAAFNPDAKLVYEVAKELAENSDSSDDQTELYWDSVKKVLGSAMENIDKMRSTEGDALRTDTLSRLEEVSHLLEKIDSLRAGTVSGYKDNLLQRLSALGLNLDLNDERVLKEVCVFADKCDIAEEVTRLRSHIAQFKTALDSAEPTGRKMDFICQEMGREANTIGSKANNLEITKSVIDIKNELERIREQIQNVE